MNLQSYPLGTLIAIASQNTKKLSEQLLRESLSITGNHRFQNVAFISTEIKQETFHKIALSNQDQLVYNDIEKPEFSSICLPKTSLLFLDLPDKSLYRNDDGILDIEHINKMLIPLKNNYNIETIIIDNIDKVDCSLMGRDLLWKTNSSNLSNYEDWKERKHEYIISLLFFMSRKFNLRIIFGKEMKESSTLPLKITHIKYMNFGFAAEMIDEIMYYNENQDLQKLKN
ncbi:hypothetical protein [Lutibacter sp.]|uniref:hypothetical protein n=1 Tax=Lutibacter sp. TaxID=1925666 RepID=UPI001A26E5DD|nr:hypothetical protein [Lutibacter sp.]MBI9041952.1 hypothetical protein [Lutibacter sp.]